MKTHIPGLNHLKAHFVSMSFREFVTDLLKDVYSENEITGVLHTMLKLFRRVEDRDKLSCTFDEEDEKLLLKIGAFAKTLVPPTMGPETDDEGEFGQDLEEHLGKIMEAMEYDTLPNSSYCEDIGDMAAECGAYVDEGDTIRGLVREIDKCALDGPLQWIANAELAERSLDTTIGFFDTVIRNMQAEVHSVEEDAKNFAKLKQKLQSDGTYCLAKFQMQRIVGFFHELLEELRPSKRTRDGDDGDDNEPSAKRVNDDDGDGDGDGDDNDGDDDGDGDDA